MVLFDAANTSREHGGQGRSKYTRPPLLVRMLRVFYIKMMAVRLGSITK